MVTIMASMLHARDERGEGEERGNGEGLGGGESGMGDKGKGGGG